MDMSLTDLPLLPEPPLSLFGTRHASREIARSLAAHRLNGIRLHTLGNAVATFAVASRDTADLTIRHPAWLVAATDLESHLRSLDTRAIYRPFDQVG